MFRSKEQKENVMGNSLQSFGIVEKDYFNVFIIADYTYIFAFLHAFYFVYCFILNIPLNVIHYKCNFRDILLSNTISGVLYLRY